MNGLTFFLAAIFLVLTLTACTVQAAAIQPSGPLPVPAFAAF